MRKTKIILLIIVAGLSISLGGAAQAAEKAAAKYMTKGEAIQLLTTSDFVKQKIGELLSWTIGYDISKVSRVRLTPTINYIKASPKKSPPDGRTIIDVQASVDDPGGLGNISGVRADLSSIGRLANTALVDNGLFGDEKANDGIFSLQTTVSPRIGLGSKDIPVAVANKKGWLALAKTALDVRKNPSLVEIKLAPDKVVADGRAIYTLTVKIDNPGRIEDLESVAADLSPLGLSNPMVLVNNGTAGDAAAGDDTWTVRFAVPSSVPAGSYTIQIAARNIAGGEANGQLILTVVK